MFCSLFTSLLQLPSFNGCTGAAVERLLYHFWCKRVTRVTILWPSSSLRYKPLAKFASVTLSALSLPLVRFSRSLQGRRQLTSLGHCRVTWRCQCTVRLPFFSILHEEAISLFSYDCSEIKLTRITFCWEVDRAHMLPPVNFTVDVYVYVYVHRPPLFALKKRSSRGVFRSSVSQSTSHASSVTSVVRELTHSTLYLQCTV